MAFHFREAHANVLTIEAGDPVTQTPELKHCAIRVERLPGGRFRHGSPGAGVVANVEPVPR